MLETLDEGVDGVRSLRVWLAAEDIPELMKRFKAWIKSRTAENEYHGSRALTGRKAQEVSITEVFPVASGPCESETTP
jgi:hypothetical protein